MTNPFGKCERICSAIKWKRGARIALSISAIFASLFSLSCNQPFQPVVEYSPRLAIYGILFSNDTTVNIRLTSTSPTNDIRTLGPAHGARVFMVVGDSAAKRSGDTVSFVESAAISVWGDTVPCYTARTRVVPGEFYTITAQKDGYPDLTAGADVPYGRISPPTAETYSILRQPENATADPAFNAQLDRSSAAWFPEAVIEYRGFDYDGHIQVGYVDVIGRSSDDPFQQMWSSSPSFTIDLERYKYALDEAKTLAGNLRLVHFYVDVVITQVNDELYRYYITSGRWSDPLAMRTDKIIQTNVSDGNGLLGAAAVDTTRIYLY